MLMLHNAHINESSTQKFSSDKAVQGVPPSLCHLKFPTPLILLLRTKHGTPEGGFARIRCVGV